MGGPSGEGASLLPQTPIPPTPKTFDWWGGRAAGVPLDLGQRKAADCVIGYKESAVDE